MIEVKQVDPITWKDMAENAHLAVFDENWQRDLERIDFALLMIHKETDQAVAYVTVQKIDESTAYIQYGGAFEKFRKTGITFEAFNSMLEYLQKSFKKIITLVENNNSSMLKFYMKKNFLITGVRYFKEHIFLENYYEA